jgi:transposase
MQHPRHGVVFRQARIEQRKILQVIRSGIPIALIICSDSVPSEVDPEPVVVKMISSDRRAGGRPGQLHARTRQGSTVVIRDLVVCRPLFSSTHIQGEYDVEGGCDESEAEEFKEFFAAHAGSPKGDRRARRRRALAPGQRWTAGRKRDVVLRLLQGESLDGLSRELGVEIYRLEQWRDKALAGIDAGLKDRDDDPLTHELDAAKRHIGELSMENELLRERSRAAEGRLPLATRRLRR